MNDLVTALNSGSATEVARFFTVSGLAGFVGAPEDATSEDVQAELETFVSNTSTVEMMEIRDIEASETDASATVELAFDDAVSSDELTFVLQDGEWLIDGYAIGTGT